MDVAGEPGFVGAGAGAAVGAAGGGLAVNGPASLLVAIVGGLVGAGIGYMAEKQISDRDGIEYLLQMDDGRLVTLVQNREGEEQPLADGTPVLVQLNGQYTRVMPHPARPRCRERLGRSRRRQCAARPVPARARADTRDLLLPGQRRGRAAGRSRSDARPAAPAAASSSRPRSAPALVSRSRALLDRLVEPRKIPAQPPWRNW